MRKRNQSGQLVISSKLSGDGDARPVEVGKALDNMAECDDSLFSGVYVNAARKEYRRRLRTKLGMRYSRELRISEPKMLCSAAPPKSCRKPLACLSISQERCDIQEDGKLYGG